MTATLTYLIGIAALIITAAIPAAITALIQWAERKDAETHPVILKGRDADQRPRHTPRR